MRGRKDGNGEPLNKLVSVDTHAKKSTHVHTVETMTKGTNSMTAGKSNTKLNDHKTTQQQNCISNVEPSSSVTNSNVIREKRWVFEIKEQLAVSTNTLPQGLQFVLDSKTNILFLLDSGSEISLIPQSLTNGINRYFPCKSKVIQGIGDKEVIHPIGTVNILLTLGKLEPIKHEFWVTKEHRDYGIIGLDILTDNQLIVCPSNSEVKSLKSNNVTKLFKPSELPTQLVMSVNQINTMEQSYCSLKEDCEKLLEKLPEVTKVPDYNLPPKHNHSLNIIVDNYQPEMIKARRCNGTREVINQHFFSLLNRGAVVRGSAIAGASPVTCVPKKDKSIRVCVDYTRLNKHTRPLSYPLPRIDELSEMIPGGTKFFSTLDLKEAYYSLPIEKQSQSLAAIITYSGVFIPRRCTFGLKNAPTRFQQMMDDMFMDCKEFTYIYLDDILIFSKTGEEHLHHLKQVLHVISKNGLCLNTEKIFFAQPQVEFLGHKVGIEGIDVQEKKVQVIRDFPLPNTRKELKRFLGMCNFYHKFVPNIAETMAPLNEISGGPKSTNRKKIFLNTAQIQAYDKTKATLANAVTLSFEDHNKPLILTTDASDTHLGAVLEQKGEGGEMRPLAFFSKKLPPLKTVRSPFYKELRALYLSLKHFQYRILGRNLLIRSDNKALVRAISNTLKNQSPMEQRYIMLIKEFNPEIEHIAGVNNKVADTLSRPPSSMHIRSRGNDPDYSEPMDTDSLTSETDETSTDDEPDGPGPDLLNKREIAILQEKNPGLIDNALKLRNTVEYIPPENLAVVVEEGYRRIVLPTPLRLRAFNLAHQVLHLGIDKSIQAVSKDYWWPTLKKDVEHWVRSCVYCQAVKVSRHNKPKIGFYPDKTERFQFLHIDLVGPLDIASVGHKYILTIKDRGTGFLVTTPVPDKKAETIRNAFVQSWCGYFGIPQIVVSDNGKEFANNLLKETFNQLGVEHRHVPPYCPQANGFIERQHRTIIQALRAETQKNNWALKLPIITTCINNTPIEGSPYTPAQYALGACTNMPGQVLISQLSEEDFKSDIDDTRVFLNIMSNICRGHKRHINKHVFYEKNLFECDKVWVRRANKRKMNTLYHGPYSVLHASEHSMLIEKNNGVAKVAIKNVKAFVPRERNLDGEKGNYNLRPRDTVVNYFEDSGEE